MGGDISKPNLDDHRTSRPSTPSTPAKDKKTQQPPELTDPKFALLRRKVFRYYRLLHVKAHGSDENFNPDDERVVSSALEYIRSMGKVGGVQDELGLDVDMNPELTIKFIIYPPKKRKKKAITHSADSAAGPSTPFSGASTNIAAQAVVEDEEIEDKDPSVGKKLWNWIAGRWTRYGDVHVEVQIHDRLIGWWSNGLVLARPLGASEPPLVLDVVGEDGAFHHLIPGSHELYSKIAKFIVEWNLTQTYSMKTSNCQAFADGILEAAGIKPNWSAPVRAFLDDIKRSPQTARPCIHHNGEVIPFASHAELDKYIAKLMEEDKDRHKLEQPLLRGFDRGFWLQDYAMSYSAKDCPYGNFTRSQEEKPVRSPGPAALDPDCADVVYEDDQ